MAPLTTNTARHQNSFNMLAEQVSARARALSQRVALCDERNKTTFETHCDTNENFSPSISAETLTIAVSTCGPHSAHAERASMVSVRAVAAMILDSGRRTSTEIKLRENLDDHGDCSIVRAMETGCV